MNWLPDDQFHGSQVVGMIDWLTLRLDTSLINPSCRAKMMENTGRLLKIDKDGRLEWESSSREVISSDSHQIVVKFGSSLEIMGSPARVVSANNVFGTLNIRQAFKDMTTFVMRHYSVIFPTDIRKWHCTRIDITRNYDMGSLDQARQALDSLKMTKSGRQKLSTEDNGVMWGKGSTLHKGKAYLKGPQTRKLVSQKRTQLSQDQLRKTDSLLRLEYTMARHLIGRLSEQGMAWYNFTPETLIQFHSHYFDPLTSIIEVTDMDQVLDLLLSGVEQGEVPTEGAAHSAYDCYTRIKIMGREPARATFPKTSWYRHIQNLKAVGLTDADLQDVNVFPLKRRPIVLDQPVSCWDDIQLKAVGA